MNLKNLTDIQVLPPEVGLIHYVVDADYRTPAQGWSKGDRTGPLDLYAERNENQVFYTSGGPFAGSNVGSSDANAIQKAIDAAVDFRGDTILLTPGSYSIGTVLSVDCPDLRILGPYASAPERARTTVTAAVAAAINITAAAKRVELGWLRLVPLTASHMLDVSDGANFQHWHDFYYDSDGITANTGTQLCLVAGAMNHSVIEKFVMHTDGAQGPLVETDGVIENLTIQHFRHYHNAGTNAISLLDIDGDGGGPFYVGHGRGLITGGGAVTAMITIVDQTVNTVCGLVEDFMGAVGYSTATGLVTVAGTGAEFNIMLSGLAQADATSLLVDFTSSANTPGWLRAVPYSS